MSGCAPCRLLTDMPEARSFVSAAVLATLATGCAVPSQYMGIDTRTPPALEEKVRVEAALAKGPAGPSGCPWLDAADKVTTIACEALPLAKLAAFASMDSKPALLELGIRFEEGRGVAQDWKRAEKAYRLAAWTNTIVTGTQVVGVAGQHGQFEPIVVPGTPGLASADERLVRLRARSKAR